MLRTNVSVCLVTEMFHSWCDSINGIPTAFSQSAAFGTRDRSRNPVAHVYMHGSRTMLSRELYQMKLLLL